MERVLKKLLISGFEQLLGNFFQIFSRYREILASTIYIPNFRSTGPFKQKLQKGEADSALSQPYQSARSPACLGLRH